MIEEVSIPRTEIVEAVFPIGSGDESVLGAFSVTGMPHLAIEAELRQSRFFGLPKFNLFLRVGQLNNWQFQNVAELVVGLDKVIATVQVAIVFDRQRSATLLAKDTQARFEIKPGSQRLVENLHEDFAYISSNPFIEDAR